MPHADTANFNRFLTSLGLLLVAVALLIPYFYFRNTDLLSIPEKELRGMTATGRKAIEGRQHAIADLEAPIVGLCIAISLCGGYCLYRGGRRLHALQGKEDAAIDRQAEKDENQIRQQNKHELEERLDEKSREVVGDTAAGIGLEESRRAVDRIRESLDENLRQATFPPFSRFLSDVEVVGDPAQPSLAIDGLFRAVADDRPDVLLALQLAVDDPGESLAPYANGVLALLARYQRLTGREATGWLVVVFVKEAKPPPLPRRETLEKEFYEALGGLGRCTALPETELTSASDRFQSLFGF